jgi:exodeoxyribonuclease (lambda-induced)
MDQRTKEWFIARLGKITASEVANLMKEHKEPMTEEELAEWKKTNPKSRVTTKTVPFSDASYTYLNGKVMENYLPIRSKDITSINIVEEYIEQHAFSNRATEWGVLMEDSARGRYAEEMGYEIIQVGFVPYTKFPNLAGGSPDGMIREEKGGIEIKCPFTLEKHLQHLLYTTPEDLKENEPEYYWQVYMNMLVTECDFWDFISYNPYVSRSKQLKVLRIKRNEEEIKLLEERLSLAVDYIREQMNKIDKIQTIIK